jgi:hypothetical protein
MADMVRARSIESARKAYETANSAMQDTMFKGLDPEGKQEVRNEVKAAMDRRMEPLSYSLDVAWRQRMQSLIDDPRTKIESMYGPMDEVNGINETGLDQALKDWLIEADPFKERPDEGAIFDRGQRLLEAIQSSFEIAGRHSATQQLQPDLVAIVLRVQRRLADFSFGRDPKRLAASVPHQMYLELRDAIDRSREFVRTSVKKDAIPRAAKPSLDSWDLGLKNQIDQVERDPKHPLFRWQVTCEKELPEIEKKKPGRKNVLDKIFQSRDLQDQMNKLYATIEDKRSKDYVMKVREAAWPVQETLDFYLRAIEGEWDGHQDDGRRALDQTLCAVGEWVQRQVNFVIAERFADPRRRAIDEGER